MKKISKIGLFISLVGGMILLGFGVYWGVLTLIYGIYFPNISLIYLIFGSIGIVGVILAYYKGISSVKRYLFIGMFYGLLAIVLIFRLFIVELIVGMLLFFIGSIIAYIGWRNERYFEINKKEKRKIVLKKSYIFLILVIITISIELILIVVLIYFPESRFIVYILMIAIPIAIPLSVLLRWLSPLASYESSISKVIEQRSVSYKKFQLANPYFCESCSKYSSFMGTLCENCGAENSLRKTTKKEYKQYLQKYPFKEE
ncbi:MAG: hypothetical protein ACFFD5_11890 [Candidatus Thorarchaeota archaeon]